MKYFTPEEEDFPRKTLGKLTIAEQAAQLGRTWDSVSKRRAKLGLYAPRPKKRAESWGSNAEAIWDIAQEGRENGLSYGQMVARREVMPR